MPKIGRALTPLLRKLLDKSTISACLAVFGLVVALAAWGDSPSIAISAGSVTVTSSSSTTLNIPVTRSSDTSYDAFVQYKTQDGTAVAGTDYTAANGSIVIPAGSTSANIPVTITGVSSNPSTNPKTFQMLLL